MSFPGGGRNPAYGHDGGPPPPTGRQPYGVGAGPTYGGPASFYPGQQPYYLLNYGRPYAGQGTYVPSTPNTGTHFTAINHRQGPTANPVINPAVPAANMTNSTGGVGCEPGYNYFFPSEHTKIHVFKTGGTPPWQLPINSSAPFHACHVPCNTTIGQLMKGFGACNPNPASNKVIEVHQGGNGRWYKGMSFKGDDEQDMAKDIKSVGWDQSRNGLVGGKPVVYLYVAKG